MNKEIKYIPSIDSDKYPQEVIDANKRLKEKWSKNRKDIFWRTETIRNPLYLKRKKWENLLLPLPIFLPKKKTNKKRWTNKIEIDSKTLIKVIAYNVLLLINQDEEENVKNLDLNELFEYLRKVKWEVNLLLENK